MRLGRDERQEGVAVADEAWVFDDFVVARGPALLRFAYLLTGDRALAEDLVQEIVQYEDGSRSGENFWRWDLDAACATP